MSRVMQAAAVTVLISLFSLQATAFDLVHTYPFDISKFSARGFGITANKYGELIVVGNRNREHGGPGFWFVRKFDDITHTWENTDEYLPLGARGSLAISTVTAPNGMIYVTGYIVTNENKSQGVLRVSADHGKTWKTVDQYADPQFASNVYYRTAVTSEGYIYVTGYGTETIEEKNVTKFLVRRSLDGGKSFETLDVLDNFGRTNFGGVGFAVLADSRDRVWLAGTKQFLQSDLTYPEGESVILRLNSGTDRFETLHAHLPKGKRAGWISLSEDSSGNIYAAGSGWRTDVDGAPRNEQSRECLVVKTEDEGITWNFIKRHSTSDRNAECYALAENGGKLFVTGYATDDELIDHAITHRSDDGGKSWVLLSDDIGSKGLGADSYFIMSSGDRVYQVGWYIEGNGNSMRVHSHASR